MNFKYTLVAAMMVAGGYVKAETLKAQALPNVDLNILQASPMDIINGLGLQKDDASKGGGDQQDDQKNAQKSKMPQACTDAAFTDDEKTKIQDAVYTSMKDQIQLQANLKIAAMTYAHTVVDKTTDLTAAQTASTALTDAITKLSDAHLALGNDILYNIVTADQRANTFKCLMALHKHGGRGGKHGGGGNRGGGWHH